MALIYHFQVAAELDRSDTARCLIERSAEAGVADASGMTALVMMISKMPDVVSAVTQSNSVTHGIVTQPLNKLLIKVYKMDSVVALTTH